ncbi:MAG: hypothetical protein AAGC56_09885 [Pseudomonadota bacterium]
MAEIATNAEAAALAALYRRTVTLASERLATMAGESETDAFDRGARSVGALVRAAVQVAALRAKSQEDAAAHARPVEPEPLSAAAVAALKADVERKLDGLDGSGRDEAGARSPKADD